MAYKAYKMLTFGLLDRTSAFAESISNTFTKPWNTKPWKNIIKVFLKLVIAFTTSSAIV
jgi:hypothetical protein